MRFTLLRNEPMERFSGLPVPDPPECDGEFRDDYCEGCSNYDECKAEDDYRYYMRKYKKGERE